MTQAKTPIKVADKKRLLARLAKLTTQRVWEASGVQPELLASVDQLYAALYPTPEDRAAITHQIKRGHVYRLTHVSIVDLEHYWHHHDQFREKSKAWERSLEAFANNWMDHDLGRVKVKVDEENLYPADLPALSARFAPEAHEEITQSFGDKVREAFAHIDQVGSQFMTLASAVQRCKTLEQIIELSPDLETLARQSISLPVTKLPAIPVEAVRSFIDSIKPLSKETV